jgi:hypothetical protein
MSRRTLEQGVVGLVEKHGIEAVEASLRMFKMATMPKFVKPVKEIKSREIKVPKSSYTPPPTTEYEAMEYNKETA